MSYKGQSKNKEMEKQNKTGEYIFKSDAWVAVTFPPPLSRHFVLVVMEGGRGLKLLDDKLQEVESHGLLRITFWLDTRHPITVFWDGNCTYLGRGTRRRFHYLIRENWV